jgi:dTDP-4-dehydrorhamnose reductase
MEPLNILILGGNGMLGHVLSQVLVNETRHNIFTSTRDFQNKNLKKDFNIKNIISNLDVNKIKDLEKTIKRIKPSIVINCIGAIKQLKDSIDPSSFIYLNSLFPHHLYRICNSYDSRLIQISTDCVFSGERGDYKESDTIDCNDLYGRSKALGEIVDKKNALTIRTSIIGHEIGRKKSLLEWFLNQEKECHGFKNAIFSGFPTVTLSRIIKNYIIEDSSLHGLYHLSSDPISKFDLLKKISKAYSKSIKILPSTNLKIDRSLDSSLFAKKTGIEIDTWDSMIDEMYNFKNKIS